VITAELVRLRSPHTALDLAVRDLAASNGAKQPRNHFADMAQKAGNTGMVGKRLPFRGGVTMSRYASVLYGSAAYAVFLGTFLYAIAFVGDIVV
jgi:hypothetical protein